jgi:L,D-transpeptidase catalytic domain/Putative peptidoglycan binding domain
MRIGGGGLRRGCLGVACVAVCLATPAAAHAGAANTAALQVALRLHGTYAGPIDGIFGPQTRRAVRRFQRHKKLVVDGVAGRRTLAALGPFARHRLGSRLLHVRKVGWDVAALQYLLARCDVSVGAVDGMFGAQTRAAVVTYQRRARLVADGVAGAVTLRGLRGRRGCHEVAGRIPQGVTVGGITLAGLTARWAETALRSAFGRPVELRAHGRSWLLDPAAFAQPHVLRAVRRALRSRAGTALPLRVHVRHAGVRRYANVVDARVCRAPRNARFVGLHRLRPRISRAHAGCRVERSQLAAELIQRFGGLGRAAVGVPIDRIRPAVTRASFGPVIVVRRGSHRFFLYDGTKLQRRLPIGTGRSANPTPLGRFTIASKIRNPWWYPPHSGWADGLEPIPPGPGNPLGTRWMGLSARGIGIHGTPDRSSVGYSRSHGCIRMLPREAEWLFRRVHLGTPVVIVAA